MELKLILESILFSAQKPMSPRELREVLSGTAAQSEDPEVKAFKKVSEEEIQTTVDALAAEHEKSGRSFLLVCVAGAWQFVNRTEFAPWLMVLLGQRPRPPRLSQPALETLAIVAYRQPVTRAEIEQVRGVAVDGVMATLVERGLVEQVGRAEVAGRPLTYGTTAFFLQHFGLRSLDELPAADELRRIPVKKPEALLTVTDDQAPPAGSDAPAEAITTTTETAGVPTEASAQDIPAAEAATDAASTAPAETSHSETFTAEREPPPSAEAAPPPIAEPVETAVAAPEAAPEAAAVESSPSAG